MDTLLQSIYESVLTGKKNEAVDLVAKALDARVDAH